MEIIYQRSALLRKTRELKSSGKSVGFVPTMGALHEGHVSLLGKSKSETDISVVSIFVNPTQFNDPNDFLKYPSSIDADLEILLKAGCDIVFVPDVEEIYPEGKESTPIVDLGYIGTCLEAAKRPGHFDGVVQVVNILLASTEPNKLYLGAKDFQQVIVIKKLVKQLHSEVDVRVVETKREADGLAMSSRNRRLQPQHRSIAPSLFAVMQEISATNISLHAPRVLTKSYFEKLNQLQDVSVDYLEIVDSQTLKPLDAWKKPGENLVCIAAFVGGIRLIDNLLF